MSLTSTSSTRKTLWDRLRQAGRMPVIEPALRLADQLADWRWKTFFAMSVLILITGSLLDSYLVPPVDHPKISRPERHKDTPADTPAETPTNDANTPADTEAPKPQVDPNRKFSIRINEDEVRIDDIDLESLKSLKRELHDIVLDIKTARDEWDDDRHHHSGLRPFGAGMGWREEPFHGLAKLMVITLLILKVIGGSRRREQSAQKAASTAERERESARLERELAEARLQQVQSQIEPHFLFNTLAALQQLIDTDPAKAATMNRHLIDWLRGGLAMMRRQNSTLAEEQAWLSDYLHLMKHRMDERLQWRIEFPAASQSYRIPSLLLQPLVENAIQHGLEPKAQGGSILIRAVTVGDRLQLSVIDDGVGFGQTGSTHPSSHRQHQGVGLDSVRSRLQLLHGDRAQLDVREHFPCGTEVIISLPLDGLATAPNQPTTNA